MKRDKLQNEQHIYWRIQMRGQGIGAFYSDPQMVNFVKKKYIKYNNNTKGVIFKGEKNG